jgi:hypothetical protein
MTATRATLPAVTVTLSIGQADSLVALYRGEADRLDGLMSMNRELKNIPTKAGELRAMAAEVEAILNELQPQRRGLATPANICGKALFEGGIAMAVCTHTHFTEHNHSDHTASEAIAAGIARPL